LLGPRPGSDGVTGTSPGGRIVTCSVTETGAALARRLPYEHRPGGLTATVQESWPEVDGLVLICATGIAVRAIAPLLADKAADPAVVVVDDGGRFAVALTGGHRGGANVLAREVAALLGAEPVVTTATDGAGLPALDTLPGFTAAGDIAAVTRAWLDGSPPQVEVDPSVTAWPLPPIPGATESLAPGRPEGESEPFTHRNGGFLAQAPCRVLVTDRQVDPAAGEAVLRPKSLVVGVGSSTGADPEALHRLVLETLAAAGLSVDAV